MKKPKKVKSHEEILKAFIIASLRRASYRWPPRNQAMTDARLSRGIYKCASCQGTFSKKDIQLDHKDPIIPVTGWDGWEGFINRLFCKAEGYQVVCSSCHSVKTLVENTERKMNRDKKKLDKSISYDIIDE